MIAMIKKELLDALRDQRTLWLSIFMPIGAFFVMMFFMGNGGSSELAVGVEEDVPEDLTTFLSETLGEWSFQEEGNAVDAAQEGDVDIGLHMENNDVVASGDMSNQSVAFGMQSLVEQWTLYSAPYRADVLAEADLSEADLLPFGFETQSVAAEDGTQTMLSYLLSFIMIFSVLLGAFPAAVDLFAGEKEKQTMESLMMVPISRIQIVIGKWFVITLIAAASGLVAVFAALLFITQFEPSGMQIEWTADFIAQLPVLAISIFLFAMFCASMLVMISIMTDSFKEAQNYVTPVLFLLIAGPVALIRVPPSQMVDSLYLIPSFNISALIQGTLEAGGVSMLAYVYTILSSFVLAVIIFCIAAKMFHNDHWALGK